MNTLKLKLDVQKQFSRSGDTQMEMWSIGSCNSPAVFSCGYLGKLFTNGTIFEGTSFTPLFWFLISFISMSKHSEVMPASWAGGPRKCVSGSMRAIGELSRWTEFLLQTRCLWSNTYHTVGVVPGQPFLLLRPKQNHGTKHYSVGMGVVIINFLQCLYAVAFLWWFHHNYSSFHHQLWVWYCLRNWQREFHMGKLVLEILLYFIFQFIYLLTFDSGKFEMTMFLAVNYVIKLY